MLQRTDGVAAEWLRRSLASDWLFLIVATGVATYSAAHSEINDMRVT